MKTQIEQVEKRFTEEVDCGSCTNQTPNYERGVYCCRTTGKEIKILHGFVARDCKHFPTELNGGRE